MPKQGDLIKVPLKAKDAISLLAKVKPMAESMASFDDIPFPTSQGQIFD